MPTPAPPDLPPLAEPPGCCVGIICSTGWAANCIGGVWTLANPPQSLCLGSCTPEDWHEVTPNDFWAATTCSEGGCTPRDLGFDCPSPPDPDTPPLGYPEGSCAGDCQGDFSASTCTDNVWDIVTDAQVCVDLGTCVPQAWTATGPNTYISTTCDPGNCTSNTGVCANPIDPGQPPFPCPT